MTNSKILYAAIEAFKQKFNEMCHDSDIMFDKLDEKSFNLISTILMDAAKSAGKAGLECYLKENDTVCPTIKNNTIVYRFKGTSINELLTLFGVITIERAMYYDEAGGGEYYFPLDYALGLEKDDFATLETREMILFASASCVPRELAELLKKCSLCTPSRTAVQNIINRDGTAMEAIRDRLSESVFEEQPIPTATQALVASLDGVNVLLREPGKKKGRKNIRPTENHSVVSPTSYRNAMVGAVSFYGANNEKKPERLCSIYTARMPQEKSTEFKNDFKRMVRVFEEKFSESGHRSIPKILLTDGHLMIKGFAKKCTQLQSYEKLLDFYHATEHLSKAADAMYGEKTDFSKRFYNKWRSRLKSDPNAPGAILRSLKGFQHRTDLSVKRCNELKTEITFFRNNKNLMKYYDFIDRGLPIGSGPIEAAAKTIVRQRMCRSGMSWSREKGQHVLTIRAYVQSGVWENAWKHFKKLKNHHNVDKWAA
jgi:hypothetical protein